MPGHASICATLILLSAFCVPAQSSPLRIMPLGDSITEAQGGHASYRYFLWHALTNGGYCVDFVGSRRGVYNGTPKYAKFDQDHEGHWGWRVDGILSQLPKWAAAAKPDVVLCHLGTNDIWQKETVASTASELGLVLDVLRKANPSVIVLLAKIIPLAASRNVDVRPLNKVLPALVASKTTAKSPVILVDHFTGFDPKIHTYDGVHPNEAGEKRMSATWLAALAKLGLTCQSSFRTFGQGCAGSAGTPALTANNPIVGKTFTVTLGSLPKSTNRPAFLIVGSSNSTWSSSPLPLSLGSAGMPSCSLLASPDQLLGLSNQAGTARWSVTIPSQPILVGTRFFLQGYVSDPGTNALGIVVSNGGEGWVGMR